MNTNPTRSLSEHITEAMSNVTESSDKLVASSTEQLSDSTKIDGANIMSADVMKDGKIVELSMYPDAKKKFYVSKEYAKAHNIVESVTEEAVINEAASDYAEELSKSIDKLCKALGLTKFKPTMPKKLIVGLNDLGSSEIALKTVGDLAPCFTSITVFASIVTFVDEFESFRFRLNYNWKHPSGSNGLNLSFYTADGGKTWDAEQGRGQQFKL